MSSEGTPLLLGDDFLLSFPVQMYNCDDEILTYLLNYINTQGLLDIPNGDFMTCIGDVIKHKRIDILYKIESFVLLDGCSFQWVL